MAPTVLYSGFQERLLDANWTQVSDLANAYPVHWSRILPQLLRHNVE